MMGKNNLQQISAYNYIEVLKPRESFLLIFIGASGAVIAAGGIPSLGRLMLILLAVSLGCGGCNGLTNYLDRGVDHLMRRTCTRSLPSHRIYPPQKVLPLVLGLIGIGLAISWYLNPLCFIAGIIGTVAAIVWRKTAWTHILGSVSGVSPLLIGWFAIRPEFNLTLLLVSLLVCFWVPLHVWSVMVAHRHDYLGAGVRIFPVTWQVKDVVKIFFAIAIILYILSIMIFAFSSFSWIYLVTANIMGLLMIYSNWRLVISADSQDAWKVYKLSAFPYLGLMFLAMPLDLLL